jgi:hypothetical protein
VFSVEFVECNFIVLVEMLRIGGFEGTGIAMVNLKCGILFFRAGMFPSAETFWRETHPLFQNNCKELGELLRSILNLDKLLNFEIIAALYTPLTSEALAARRCTSPRTSRLVVALATANGSLHLAILSARSKLFPDRAEMGPIAQ